MIKIRAFIKAFVLFVIVVLILNVTGAGIVKNSDVTFGAINSSAKFNNAQIIKENIDEKSLIIFGSSEFWHGDDTIYHPINVFAGSEIEPVLIGAKGYQTLNHTITLAALGDKVKNKKVVIILSPSWFVKEGVSDVAFANKFSEINYNMLMKNDSISEKTKDYIKSRTGELLVVDPKTLKRIESADKGPVKRAYSFVYNGYMSEKLKFGYASKIIGAHKTEIPSVPEDKKFDWDYYRECAEKESENYTDKEYYMSPKGYKHITPRIEKSKDALKDLENIYANSKELGDLRCFLDVCKDLEVTPLLVMIPVNGYWYRYMGSEPASREKYYENLRQVAKEYGVQYADLSEHEFTKYFFEDNVHVNGKGWVAVDEAIYEFAK